jgi:amidohydrolase
MTQFLEESLGFFEYTRALRRDFHRHPELGFQEVRTAHIVAKELISLGLKVSQGVAETGVIAMIEGAQAGPMVLLRFDMDALPISEETGTEYASEFSGIMHACGHDGHVAIGLTVAKLLNYHRLELAGSVKLVFQPAEEGLGGAKRMIEAGVLENPRPDYCLACHVWNEKPTGWIGITYGPIMAAGEIFHVRITGKGGHGAVPNYSIDPVLASAQVIVALQSIVTRNISPLQSAIVSVTMVRGGDAFNIIPSFVEMQGTIRSFEPDVRKMVIERFQQIVKQVAGAFGCQSTIEITSVTPAVINDIDLSRRVQNLAAQLLPGVDLAKGFKTMGSEDMAFFMQDIPGCFIFIGSAKPEKGLTAAHHHPRFDFDEQVLSTASALLAAATVDLLKV